jgi:hypothetical protein
MKDENSFSESTGSVTPAPNKMIEITAKTNFEHALRKGYWRSVISWFTRSQNDLLPFDEIRRSIPLGGQHHKGMQQILMDKIVGSIGRYQDFDRAFLPRRGNTRGRWESIDKAHLQDISLPPIEVYQLGEVYFVKDGNHRVSVARERGQAYIDASVTEIDVPFPIDENTDVEEIIRNSETIQFNDKTKLIEVCPGANIQFTVPGGSSKVLEHIDVHRWYMGEKRKDAVAYPEAVRNWYDEVYLPLVRVIRQYRILDHFPGRTEADLYLWIIEHLYYLREEYQAEVSLEQAATHFSEGFSPKPFSWLMNFLHRVTSMIEHAGID